MADHYENSIVSLAVALSISDGIETDAIRSKEKTVYLAHDTAFIQKVKYELSRHLSDEGARILGDRCIDQLNDDEIDALPTKYYGGLVRLYDLLELAHEFGEEKTLNIELKGEDVAESVVKEIHTAVEQGLIKKNQIIISSFNHGQLKQVRAMDPELKIGVLFSLSYQPEGNQLHPWSSTDKGCYIPFKKACLKAPGLKALQPEFFNIGITDITEENVDAVIRAFPSAELMIWSLGENDPFESEDTNRVLESATILSYTHSIITNYPRRMRELFIQKGLPVPRL